MAAKTHYDILSVASSASTDEIRKAYHRLAREHHPDRFRDPAEKTRAEEMFTAMTDAFNILSDTERRREYDASLRGEQAGENPAAREAKTYFRAGSAKLSQGACDDAIRALKAAVHLQPDEGAYHAKLAEALTKKPALGEAARAWDEAIKREPYNGKYYRMAGQCLEKAGMTTKARRMYESALKWNKNDPEAEAGLGRLTGNEKKPGKGFLGSIFKKA